MTGIDGVVEINLASAKEQLGITNSFSSPSPSEIIYVVSTPGRLNCSAIYTYIVALHCTEIWLKQIVKNITLQQYVFLVLPVRIMLVMDVFCFMNLLNFFVVLFILFHKMLIIRYFSSCSLHASIRCTTP